MKHLGRLALLGALVAAAVPFASAIPIELSGAIDTQDASVNASYSSAAGFAITSLNTISPEPTSAGVLGPLGSFTLNTTYQLFSGIGAASSIGPILMWTGTTAGGDSISFYATGILYALTVQAGNNDIDVTLAGYFTADTSGSYSQTAGSDDITFDTTGGSYTPGGLSEDLVAIPAPEPNGLLLVGTGLIGAAGLLIRRRRTA